MEFPRTSGARLAYLDATFAFKTGATASFVTLGNRVRAHIWRLLSPIHNRYVIWTFKGTWLSPARQILFPLSVS